MEKRMIKEAIKKISIRRDLSFEEARAVTDEIFSGKCSDAQIAGLIMGLAMKGETVDEISGLVTVMKEKAIRVKTSGKILDTCGTGGDASGTFNISTAAAFIISACGQKVAKHGNRSVSSACGSADVLKASGVNIECPREITERCIEELGIGFIFAPLYHQAMKYAMPARRDLGIRTIFNIAGPMSNPAFPQFQVMGVFSEEYIQKMARVLNNTGTEAALIIHSSDGLDEISLTGLTSVAELRNGNITEYELTPSHFGIKSRDNLDGARAVSVEDAKKIFISVLNGEEGPALDLAVINAASGLYISGVCGDFKECGKMAMKAVKDGAALDKLSRLVKLTNSVG